MEYDFNSRQDVDSLINRISLFVLVDDKIITLSVNQFPVAVHDNTAL